MLFGVLAVEEESEGGGGVGLAHECFTDEEGVIAYGAEFDEIVRGSEAAFGDHDGLAGHPGGELQKNFGADGKGSEVAAVDTDQVEAEVDGALELLTVVGFAEDVEADAVSFVAEIAEAHVGVCGDDEEDGVGTGSAGFEDLEGVEDEFLAKAGDADLGGGGGEMVERALEKLLVGKDGEGGGTVGFEATGQVCGVEIFADETLGGGGLLDFGDDGWACFGGGAEGCGESTGGVEGGSAL